MLTGRRGRKDIPASPEKKLVEVKIRLIIRDATKFNCATGRAAFWFFSVFGGILGVRVKRDMVEASALTLALSPRRGNDRSPSLILRKIIRPVPSLEFSKKRRTILPFPGERAG